MVTEYMVEGYKTPYKGIIRARAAAYRLVSKKNGPSEVRVLEKIAPYVYSEIALVRNHPKYKGEKAVWYYDHAANKYALLDSRGLVNWYH